VEGFGRSTLRRRSRAAARVSIEGDLER